jgi:hypothetical protein
MLAHIFRLWRPQEMLGSGRTREKAARLLASLVADRLRQAKP